MVCVSIGLFDIFLPHIFDVLDSCSFHIYIRALELFSRHWIIASISMVHTAYCMLKYSDNIAIFLTASTCICDLLPISWMRPKLLQQISTILSRYHRYFYCYSVLPFFFFLLHSYQHIILTCAFHNLHIFPN